MSKKVIIKVLFSIAFLSFILFNNLIVIPGNNTNRYIIYTFDKCNDELAYVINDLSNKIYSVDEEMLNDEKYIEEIFGEANRKLRFWERIMDNLHLLNKNFMFDNLFRLREYFYTIIDKGKLTEEDLKILEKIFMEVNYINPGRDNEIEKKYMDVYPSKKVKESLEKIFNLCDKAIY